MPIYYDPISEAKLESLKDVHDRIKGSQNYLQRVPVEGFIENDATFHDDEYFGDGDVMFRFNSHSIKSFCQLLGFRFDQLKMIESPTLPSQVLNDLIQQSAIKEKLKGDEFVIDTRNNVIIGLVSRTYVGYTNDQFLEDIENYLKKVAKDQFQFHEAFEINTELTLRYQSKIHHGTIQGRSGQGEDRTLLGLEFRNSMVGTSAVRINYYLFRLVCSNGMMVPAGSAINRVFHSGNRDSFHKRLEHCYGEVIRKIGSIVSMLRTLGEIPFDPDRLAANQNANVRIFDIIPALKQSICDEEKQYLRYPPDYTEEEKRQIRLEHDSRIIELIPRYYGGEVAGRIFKSQMRDSVTMFDFLNVFTEYAKKCRVPSEQLEIEEKTGNLAKYISDNAKKF